LILFFIIFTETCLIFHEYHRIRYSIKRSVHLYINNTRIRFVWNLILKKLQTMRLTHNLMFLTWGALLFTILVDWNKLNIFSISLIAIYSFIRYLLLAFQRWLEWVDGIDLVVTFFINLFRFISSFDMSWIQLSLIYRLCIKIFTIRAFYSFWSKTIRFCWWFPI
jgi:hypothetical protein